MNAKVGFENPAPARQDFHARACLGRATVVSTQISPRLLAFKNRRDCLRPWTIGSDIGPVARSRQADFQSARAVTLGLGPEERMTFQPRVRVSFRAASFQLLVHSAS
jgi:hypothetical protein